MTALCLPFVLSAAGGVLGTVTNLSHAMISGEYFVIVLRRAESPYAIAFEHGWIEGGIAGFIFGVLVTSFFAVTGWRWLTWRHLLRPLLYGLAAAALCMIVGGVVGAAWATLSPQSYLASFYQARQAANVTAFGWVGGSIWGAYAGIVVAIVTAAIVWARRLVALASTERGFDVKSAP